MKKVMLTQAIISMTYSLTPDRVCAFWYNNVYVWHLNITQIEMLNVLIALRMFCDTWCHKSLCMYIDKTADMLSREFQSVENPKYVEKHFSDSVW